MIPHNCGVISQHCVAERQLYWLGESCIAATTQLHMAFQRFGVCDVNEQRATLLECFVIKVAGPALASCGAMHGLHDHFAYRPLWVDNECRREFAVS